MGLDPNDIRLAITADVSAPGAEQAAQQIRGAGQAADQTRASFDRLRETGGQAGAQQVVAAPPVNPSTYDPVSGRDATVANQLVRSLVQQREATDAVFKNAFESVRRSTGVTPTISPAELGITPAPVVQAATGSSRRNAGGGVEGIAPSPTTQAQTEAEQRRANQAAQQRAERDARLEGRSFSRITTGQAVSPIRGQDEEDIHETTGTLVRSAGALVGIGFGLSAVVGTAKLLHDSIVGTVDAQLDWERSLRETAGLYGDLAPRAEAVARAQASTAGVVGNEQDFLQANLRARFLTTRYGVSESAVNQLTLSAGRTAYAEGLKPDAAQALQEQTVAAVESGGTQLRDRGVNLDPESVARQLGFSSGASLAALTPSQLDQARTAIATIGLNTYSDQARQRGAGLLDARTAAQQALEQGRTQLQNQLEGGALNPNSLVAPLEGGGYGSAAARENAPDIAALQKTFDAADAAVQEFQQKLGTSADAVQQARDDLEKLGVSADSAAARLLSLGGSLEDPYSRARGDIGSQAQAAEASRAIGPNPLAYQSAAEIATQAQQKASDEARRAYDAVGSQRSLAQTNANQEYLQRLADQQGPGLDDQRARAQAALADADRRNQADLAVGQGTQAQALAQRAQGEAQAGVSAIDLVDQQRELDRAGELASLRTETLNREGNIVDLQRQQADLADRQAVAGRENLDLLRQQTQARLDSLGATNRLNDVQFATQRDQLSIQAIRADVRRGALDPSALNDIPGLRQQLRQEQLATPRAQLDALFAQRPAQLAGQNVEQDQLQIALRQIPLTQQQRGLEDTLTPLQQQQRGTDERTQGINRELELARLAEEPQRTAAERNVLSATAVALAADQSVRSAQEWAANIHDGLTDLERAWQLLGGIAPGPGTSAPGATDQAAGADRTTITVNVTNAKASPQDITNAMLQALNQRAQRGPRAAPRTLVGAR